MICKEYEMHLAGFDEFIENILKEWKVPGAALAIIKGDEVIYSNCFGMRDPEKGLEVNEKTLFRMASNTKAFTSMSLGILVDEGKLDLDKPFKHYIPWFKLYNPMLTEHLTPRDALSHRSGLPAHDGALKDIHLSRREIVERMQYLEPSADLRSVLQYNSLMYVLSAYLVECITGEPWESFVQKRILDPLGMMDTNFSYFKSMKSGNYAINFYEDNGELHEFKDRREIDPEFLFPKGPGNAINSNLSDMIKWVRLHLNKGTYEGKRIVSEKSIYQILRPQMLDRLPVIYKELGYLSTGMGWFQHPFRGYNAVEHMGFFGTQIFLIPEERLGVVYLPTLSTGLREVIPFNIFERMFGLNQLPWNERYKADNLRMEQQMEAEKQKNASDRIPGTKPSHPLGDYAGIYEHPAYGKLTIIIDGEELLLEQLGSKSGLKHYHYDTFEAGTGPWAIKLTFHTDAKGIVRSVSSPFEPSVSDIVFVRTNE